MRILVATASKHGATREIGTQLGSDLSTGLKERGVDAEVTVLDTNDVDTVMDYDAVVLGSAIYFGRWLKSADKLVDRELMYLEDRPVWLFSSGPVTPGDKAESSKWATVPWAVEHHMFGGKIDRSVLNFAERLAMRALHAEDGDYRNVDEIRSWADSICTHLTARTVR
ncbi:UNVERIFIED_CONTAM: menaquinone-dependent protoporphyrinogen oxidase [Williamsia faeni]